MTTANHAILKEVKIGSAAKFQTIISIKGGHAPHEVVELKFETLFGKAKDPLARQTKGQFFVSHRDLIALRDEITEFIKQSEQSSQRILNRPVPRHELEASSLYERLISNLPLA